MTIEDYSNAFFLINDLIRDYNLSAMANKTDDDIKTFAIKSIYINSIIDSFKNFIAVSSGTENIPQPQPHDISQL